MKNRKHKRSMIWSMLAVLALVCCLLPATVQAGPDTDIAEVADALETQDTGLLAERETLEPEFPEEPAPEEELYGDWFGNVYGLTICLSLKEDGIYGVSFTDTSREQRQGTWILEDGFIYMDEETIPSISVMRESLAWTATGTILTREKEEYYTPAAVNAQAAPEDFDGYWKSAYVETDGALMDASALQNETDIYIEGTNVALGGPMFGDVIAVFEYADGTMTYWNGDEYASAQITMQMLEDGYLAVTLITTIASEGEDGNSVLTILLAPAYTPYLDPEAGQE